MKNTHSPSSRINLTLTGLLASLFLSVSALFVEPRLLPLAMILGPAFVGLVFPPDGRRVYRDLGIAVLIASAVVSIMLFMPAVA